MSTFRCSPLTAKEIYAADHPKSLYSQTYKSKKADFSLNPANIFDVVCAIEDYQWGQHWKARGENLRPENSVQILYNGNKLEVLAGTYDRSVSVAKLIKNHTSVKLAKVTLAELLVLPKKFTLKILEHENLVVDPTDLVKICKKYEL